MQDAAVGVPWFDAISKMILNVAVCPRCSAVVTAAALVSPLACWHRSGSVCSDTPLESSLWSGQPSKVEAVLAVPLVSGESCTEPQALVDLRYKGMDFEEYLNVCRFFQVCRASVQSHHLFVPVDKFCRAGTIFPFILCFAKWVVMGVWVVRDMST